MNGRGLVAMWLVIIYLTIIEVHGENGRSMVDIVSKVTQS
jgi:hypothetical protein